MGKSEKEFQRFEKVTSVILEMMDKVIEMKKLQNDEFRMKFEHERERVDSVPKIRSTKVPLMKDGGSILDEINKVFPYKSEKFPVGGIVVGTNRDIAEFISPKFGTIDCDCPQCQARRNA